MSVQQYWNKDYADTFYIPANLKKVTITGGEILYGAFYGCSQLETVVLSADVKGSGQYAFYNCTALTEFQYEGTTEQWKANLKFNTDGWNSYIGNYTVTCTDGTIAKNGTVTKF